MAQKPFITDMGVRLGEWLITQNGDGHLAVGPVDVTTNSQRAFRVDQGFKMGDWKFYENSDYLTATPNGTSGSQRPFLVDAGLKISDWTITQNSDGNIFISTTASVTSGLNSSTAVSSGTVSSYDVDTMSFEEDISFSSNEVYPQDRTSSIHISPDGSTLVFKNSLKVRAYSMSTPFDLSTATRNTDLEPHQIADYTGTKQLDYNHHAEKSGPWTLSKDWTKVLTSVHQSNTPRLKMRTYDISQYGSGTSRTYGDYSLEFLDNIRDTITNTSVRLSNYQANNVNLIYTDLAWDDTGSTTGSTEPDYVLFNDDETRMYWGSEGYPYAIGQIDLTEPFNVNSSNMDLTYNSGETSAVGVKITNLVRRPDGVTSGSAGETSVQGWAFSSDGTKLFALSSGGVHVTQDTPRGRCIYQFDLDTAWDLATAHWDNEKAFLFPSNIIGAYTITEAGGYLFVLVYDNTPGDAGRKIFRYSFAESSTTEPTEYDGGTSSDTGTSTLDGGTSSNTGTSTVDGGDSTN